MTRRVKKEIQTGFKAVPKEQLRGHVGSWFTLRGDGWISARRDDGSWFRIDNRAKTIFGLVVDERKKEVKILASDSRCYWVGINKLLHLLVTTEKDDGTKLKESILEKIEILSKPESQGLSISDTKEILQQCLAALNHTRPVQDGSSK
jgi:hypothetical protein